MSKRLQVILDEDEYRDIQRAAERSELTVSEWVRRSLARQRRSEPARHARHKLEAIRSAAARSVGPAVEIEQMLEEIERGYLATGEGREG